MSVEALSWAFNHAPAMSPAERLVLLGLANHAGPDGRAAFPSVARLMRYTCLAERTVRRALRQLEAAELIRPCDPAIIAAHIARADRRPAGWDLQLDRISQPVDKPGEELPYGGPERHPAEERGARAPLTGGQTLPNGGPEWPPSLTRTTLEPSSSPARELAPAAEPVDNQEEEERLRRQTETAWDNELLAELRAAYPSVMVWRIPTQLRQDLRRRGWEPSQLVPALAELGPLTGAQSEAAVLSSRLRDLTRVNPPAPATPPAPWCGKCDPDTRLLELEAGGVSRCPLCHPLTERKAAS